MRKNNNEVQVNKNDLYTRLASTIKEARIRKGETPESMAKKLNYRDSSAYYKIERGEIIRFDVKSLLELCDVLDLSFLVLLHRAGVDLNKNINHRIKPVNGLKESENGLDEFEQKEVLQRLNMAIAKVEVEESDKNLKEIHTLLNVLLKRIEQTRGAIRKDNKGFEIFG